MLYGLYWMGSTMGLMKMNEFDKIIKNCLVSNAGNKLTEELMEGMYAKIITAHKSEIEKLASTEEKND